MTAGTLHVESPRDVGAIRDRLSQARADLFRDEQYASASVATLNFVVFIDDPSHRAWVLERAARVAEKHASRMIVLDSTDEPRGVDVRSERRAGAAGCVFTERIDVAVKTIDHQAIITLVADLCLPDIPIMLWWSGSRLMQSRTFAGLARQSESVLVDSSGKVDGEEIIRELGEFLGRYPDVVLADLAFMRLAPWREMIAQFFDDRSLREDLFSIESLEIESGSEAEALYLAGWLGSRLSWEIAERDAFRDRRGKRIPFTMIAKGERRRVRSVILRTDATAYRAELSDDDSDVVALSMTGPNASPTRYEPLQNIANTDLIERAILESARDEMFETSLRTVRDLLA